MTPTETVNSFIAAVEERDIDLAATLLAKDVSYENMPMEPIVGRDAVAQTLRGFLASATEVDWPCSSQYEIGNRVINERVDRFKIGEGWLELPVAGFFEVGDDNLITLWRDYFDMATYQTQLGNLIEPLQ